MEQLISAGLVCVGDPIHFTFKKNHIMGMVGRGGHILHTVIITESGQKNMTLYPHSYPSLTAWSEACLREGLYEENTRYASWKRIIHEDKNKKQRTLQSLRSELNVNTKHESASRQDLYSELNRMHATVMQMKRVPRLERESAATTDNLLMMPSVIASFKRWAETSWHRG
tara:strand:- start:1355 stop:1864 length:510 start_codon:yes stop_codon:yes gene_type:complete